MPVTIKVNGTTNSLVHKGSNGISTATLPVVCKTPSPGGPVPIPYPNISQASSLAKGTTTVKADGGMMIATKGSEFSLSNGDNAGTAGGVKSSTFMKESTWILYSFDVKMDGQNACRLTDKKFQNHENTADLAGVIQDPKSVDELETMLCRIWAQCQRAVTRKNKSKNKKWDWCNKDGNRFKTGGDAHRCCKQKLEAAKKKNAKKKRNKGTILPKLQTDPRCNLPNGGYCKPDVVVGSPAEQVYDFKFQCPPTAKAPKWPLYSAEGFANKVHGVRKPPNPIDDELTQDKIIEAATGKEPKMINENTEPCSKKS